MCSTCYSIWIFLLVQNVAPCMLACESQYYGYRIACQYVPRNNSNLHGMHPGYLWTVFSREKSPILFHWPTRVFSGFLPSVRSSRDGYGNRFLPRTLRASIPILFHKDTKIWHFSRIMCHRSFFHLKDFNGCYLHFNDVCVLYYFIVFM